jgi:hypothetical protein
MASPGVLAYVDHLVYTTPDLDRGIVEIERLLGVRPTLGGRHPAWGTPQRACSARGDVLPRDSGAGFGTLTEFRRASVALNCAGCAASSAII